MTYTLDPLPPTATPSDYLRLQFDPAQVPAKRIVGLLACQRDPLLRSLTTRITSLQPASLSAPPPQKGKAKKKPAPSEVPNGTSETPKGSLWELETLDTVIFPEGGGQPFDTGSAVFTDSNGGERRFVVEGCLRKGLETVHLVRVGEGETLEGLEGKVRLEVDWERRVDHMSIHTAQHLLSAVLDTYPLATLSWSLTAYPALETPYVELPRGLTWHEAESVEKRCNELIEESLKVWVDVNVQQDGEHAKYTSTGERENRGIPQDYKGGVIRTVNIDGIDKNACCGTQVPNLSHCGFVHVVPPSCPSTSDKPSTGPTKLYFTAGPRAVRYLQQSSRTLSLSAQALGCGRADLVEKAARTEDQRRDLVGRERDLRLELGRVVGEVEAAKAGDGRMALIKRDDRTTHDYEFLGSLAFGVLGPNQEEQKVKGRVVVCVSSPGGVTPALVLVQSFAPDRAKGVYEGLKIGLEGVDGSGGKGRVRGGGAKGRYMAKVEGKWGKKEDEAIRGVVDEFERS